MPSTKVIQRSFAGGEVSPEMFGRIDDVKYQNGLETCKNFIALPQGPVENRPGLEYVREAKFPDKACRLIPFTFRVDQTMVIELGDHYARFHTEGATLLDDDGEPYEIETPWAAEDLFDLHYVQSADIMTIVHPSYPPTELRRYSVLDWRVHECDFSAKLSSPTNVFAKRETSAADDKNADKYRFRYKVSALNSDKSIESEAVEADYDGDNPEGVVANLYSYGTTVRITWAAVEGASFYRVYKCQGGLFGYIGDTEDLYIIDDDIDPDMSITPRRFDDVFNTSGGITSVTVQNGGSGYEDIRRGLADDDGTIVFTNTYTSGNGAEGSKTTRPWSELKGSGAGFREVTVWDEGGHGSGAEVELLTEYSSGTSTHSYGDGNSVKYTWSRRVLTGLRFTNRGANYVKPKIRFRGTWYSARNGSVTNHNTKEWTANLNVIESGCELVVTDPTGSGAELVPVIKNGVITSVTIRNPGRGYTNPTVTVRSNKGTGAVVEASVGTGGDYPAAVGYYQQRRCFAGMANDPQRVVMTVTGTEDNFTYSLPVRDDDRISHQIATTQFNQIRHIVPLSSLILLTSGSEVLVSSGGADSLTATSFRASTQSYNGSNNVQPIITNNNIIYCAGRGGHVREYAYKDQAGGYVSGDLCLRSAHLFDYQEIVDCAYARAPIPILWFVSTSGKLLGLTYVPEEGVGSWHQHETQGRFESCACVAEGDYDALYVVVRRTIAGEEKRFVERMAKREEADLKEAFFVDCGGTYRGEETTTISGLAWLEGQEVSVLADGAVLPTKTVTAGKIELDVPASVVHVGLPYTSDCKTLPVVLQEASFGMGLAKNVSRVVMRVYQTSGILAGSDFDEGQLVEYKQRKTEQPGQPPAIVSGEVSIALRPKWTDGGAVCVRQSDPLPLKLLSMTLELSV